jgi:hypothetical protein
MTNSAARFLNQVGMYAEIAANEFGWPYLDCPCSVRSLASDAARRAPIDPRVVCLPSVSQPAHAVDVESRRSQREPGSDARVFLRIVSGPGVRDGLRVDRPRTASGQRARLGGYTTVSARPLKSSPVSAIGRKHVCIEESACAECARARVMTELLQ